MVIDQIAHALLSLPEALQKLVHIDINQEQRKISLFQEIHTTEDRSAAAAALCTYWRIHQKFRVLEGWRSELYPVYGPNNKLLWSIERSASALFGTVTYGVHLTAFTRDSSSRYGIKLWIPRRAKTKQTFGGMLDNTVGGGIAVGEEPLDSLTREAEEEAGLEKDMVRKKVKPCGTVTYNYVRDSRAGGEVGLIQPECQYVYDLELENDIIPRPNDGEVEEYYLWTVDEVQAAMRRGEFKPNCAIVMLDFFIRWNILTKENETDYTEIERRIHRKLEFPGPHQMYES